MLQKRRGEWLERIKKSGTGSSGLGGARQVAIYFAVIAIGALVGLAVSNASALEFAINPALAMMLLVTFLQVPVAELGAALRDTRFLGALLATNFVVMPVVTAVLVQFLP